MCISNATPTNVAAPLPTKICIRTFAGLFLASRSNPISEAKPAAIKIRPIISHSVTYVGGVGGGVVMVYNSAFALSI